MILIIYFFVEKVCFFFYYIIFNNKKYNDDNERERKYVCVINNLLINKNKVWLCINDGQRYIPIVIIFLNNISYMMVECSSRDYQMIFLYFIFDDEEKKSWLRSIMSIEK